ncbi:MAG: flagellar basal-body MS-ring/collar protein FliF [Firmicutes bacterium]|nr:flagellar basal-body MS-ring/collar protein FliF [Bacillota bacterium]
MNDRVQAYLTRIRQWWQAQSPSKRWRVVVLAALAVGVVVAGFVIISSPDWQPLYTNLNARTAGQITSELTTMKVPYQLTDGGSTILVPKADVNQVRVSLADQNIPSSTVGLPSSLTFSLGESDQEIQLQELANLEATLESTIDSINGVRSSRVLINQPAPSLFGETTQESTASVFVDLAPGASLSAGQVRGIMNLVAHSVSGLSVNEVSVVDQNGTVLSASALNNDSAALQVSGVSGAELAAENAVSTEIRNNVQNMLDQVLGPGNAVVQVSAVLNFNHSSVTSVAYGHAVLSSQEVQTSSSSGTTPPSPAVGTQGNTPTVTTAASTGTSKSNSRTTVDKYLVDTTKTSQVVPAGQIQRLTVAVVVDQKLSPKEAKSLRLLVANAAGVNFKAGDQVTVVGMPFNRTAVSQALAAMQKAQRAQTIREGVLALLALGTFIFLVLMLRRAFKNRPPQAEAPPVALPTAVGGQIDFQEPMSVAELLDEMRQQKEPSISERARQRLDELARHDPETAARLLRTWMEEDNS